jgi:lipoprotein-releasing system permease protein
MYRPVELFIALRHLRSRNRNRFVSFISLISVVGIALSVAVLMVVLSVMNGFEAEVKDRILEVVPHASITGIGGRIEDWKELSSTAAGRDDVVGVAPFVDGQGMLVSDAETAGIELRGILPEMERSVARVEDLIVAGGFDGLADRGYKIVIGRVLAERLQVKVGDSVVLLVTEGSMTPIGLMPRMRRFEVTGIFYAGMYDIDRSLAYIHMADAGRLSRIGDAATGVSVSVSDPLAAPEIIREIALQYGGNVYVSDWTRQHANFFRSIELTKSIIFIILLMVVAVAAFNIVSTLVMVVREKSSEIAILRSMGASATNILWIFVAEGTLIGFAGTIMGLLAGTVLALNLASVAGVIESVMGISFIAPDVYFISELPSRLEFSDVWRVCLVAFLLAVSATIYPALRGAWTNPATALRHD